LATLDDSAEALTVKLRGLDSEIEESEHQVQDCRNRIETVSHELEQEWTALGEAVSSFLTKVHEQRQHLGQEAQQALHATSEAQQAVASSASEAHSEIAEARTHLDGLAHHATALQPGMESLATEAGEAPTHALAQRAAQLEQELTQALDEVHDFLSNTVAHGLEQLAHDIQERCQAVRTTLAEQAAHALQAAFEEWESKVDGLEEYVKREGFLASHDHARASVDYALGACQTDSEKQLDQLHQVVDGLGGQLQELASEVQRSAEAIVADTGSELAGRLEDMHQAADSTLSALGSVRELLASRSFVQM